MSINVTANAITGQIDVDLGTDHHSLAELALVAFKGGSEGDYVVNLLEDLGEAMFHVETANDGDWRSLTDVQWRPDRDAVVEQAFERLDEVLKRIDAYIPSPAPRSLTVEQARALAIELAEAAESLRPSLSLVERLKEQNLADVAHLFPQGGGAA